ncbi:MAG: DUF1036 domain-containing protein [Pseudanabaena sp. ELA645]|jgi:uncharacterized membrane protein
MKCNFGYLVLFTIVASSVSNIVFQEEANAWVNICNRGSTRIEKLAVGYSENGDWKSDGWWSLDPGECGRVYERDLEDSRKAFYYYVEGRGWGTRSDGAFCIATNRNFTYFKSNIESKCGQTLTKTECNFGPNGEGCSERTFTFFTKFVNFARFGTSGRNFTLNLNN